MSSAAPSRHRFTVDEYHRLGNAGLFANERVEVARVSVDVVGLIG